MRLLVAIPAFNRPRSLRRLLHSLARVPEGGDDFEVDLLISVDGGGDPECVLLAEQFEWHHGKKRTQLQENWLGLQAHIEWISDQVSGYSGLVILEDDLTVSPWFLHYARQALEVYGNEPGIAQISLYSPRFNEFGPLPFLPQSVHGDSYFGRFPSSWGQIITPAWWRGYRDWCRGRNPDAELDSLPDAVGRWKWSWKRGFFNYISRNRLLVVYPMVSLTSNHGDPGVNFKSAFPYFEVPLETRRRDYRFPPIGEGEIVYDEFYEPELDLSGHVDQEIANDLTVDLQGLRPRTKIRSRYLLSIRPCRCPLYAFEIDAFPPELNFRLPTPRRGPGAAGSEMLSIGPLEGFDFDTRSGRDYFIRRDPLLSIERQSVRDAITRSRRYRMGTLMVTPFAAIRQCIGKIRRRAAW